MRRVRPSLFIFYLYLCVAMCAQWQWGVRHAMFHVRAIGMLPSMLRLWVPREVRPRQAVHQPHQAGLCSSMAGWDHTHHHHPALAAYGVPMESVDAASSR